MTAIRKDGLWTVCINGRLGFGCSLAFAVHMATH